MAAVKVKMCFICLLEEEEEAEAEEFAGALTFHTNTHRGRETPSVALASRGFSYGHVGQKRSGGSFRMRRTLAEPKPLSAPPSPLQPPLSPTTGLKKKKC